SCPRAAGRPGAVPRRRSFDDVPPDHVFAQHHGADEAQHGDDQRDFEVDGGLQVHAQQHQLGDGGDVEGVQGQDPVGHGGAAQQPPERQHHRESDHVHGGADREFDQAMAEQLDAGEFGRVQGKTSINGRSYLVLMSATRLASSETSNTCTSRKHRSSESAAVTVPGVRVMQQASAVMPWMFLISSGYQMNPEWILASGPSTWRATRTLLRTMSHTSTAKNRGSGRRLPMRANSRSMRVAYSGITRPRTSASVTWAALTSDTMSSQKTVIARVNGSEGRTLRKFMAASSAASRRAPGRRRSMARATARRLRGYRPSPARERPPSPPRRTAAAWWRRFRAGAGCRACAAGRPRAARTPPARVSRRCAFLRG